MNWNVRLHKKGKSLWVPESITLCFLTVGPYDLLSHTSTMSSLPLWTPQTESKKKLFIPYSLSILSQHQGK